jgi:hypothetical protein
VERVCRCVDEGFASRVPVFLVFEDVRVGSRHFDESIGRTGTVNGAAITVDTDVVLNLKVHGAVAIGATTVDTLGTTYAVVFFDLVLVVGFFDEGSFDSVGGAVMVFCAFIEVEWVGDEVGSAQIAVTTGAKGVNSFNSGGVHNTVSFTFPALSALVGVDLPNFFLSFNAIVHQ